MRVRGKGVTLQGTEGSSPPLPFLEVSNEEGEHLIRLGIAEEVPEDDAPAKAPTKKSEPKVEEPKVETPPPPPPAPETQPEPAKVDEDRATLIRDAIDLVEADGLETEGDRKGKPTIAAIHDITGLGDVTVEEIDAAVAAHASA